jgi:hypothetical protein
MFDNYEGIEHLLASPPAPPESSLEEKTGVLDEGATVPYAESVRTCDSEDAG